MPDISVVIPTFNRLCYLQQAVVSCFEDNQVHVQVVVVDDGSTDGTRDWLTRLDDPRVIVILADHGGAPRARNAGLSRSQSPYVKFLDDDDVLVAGSLDAQLAHIGKTAPDEIPYGRVGWIDEQGARFGETQHRVRSDEEDVLLHVMYNNIMTSAPLHRREALIKVGGFDEALPCHQEYELHLRLAAHGYRFKFFDEIVYLQRHHLSLSRISSRDRLADDPMFAMRLLDGRLQMLRKATNDDVKRDWLIGLSRMYWNYGRHMIRLRNDVAARRYFDRARELAGANAIADPWYYRLIAKAAGPWCAEWVSRQWVRLLKRIPADACEQARPFDPGDAPRPYQP